MSTLAARISRSNGISTYVNAIFQRQTTNHASFNRPHRP
jgi:hypothetical protein